MDSNTPVNYCDFLSETTEFDDYINEAITSEELPDIDIFDQFMDSNTPVNYCDFFSETTEFDDYINEAITSKELPDIDIFDQFMDSNTPVNYCVAPSVTVPDETQIVWTNASGDWEKLKSFHTKIPACVGEFCVDKSSPIIPFIGHKTKAAGKYRLSNCSTPTASSSSGVRKERSLHYCSICSKGFKDKYSVNVHIRTHTGEKPFTCSLCGKSFRQKAHLAKHNETHLKRAKNGLSFSNSAKNLIPSS